ncbi:prolipoprotein diacylglyceryl transferase [Chloroflexota bacterium]
MIHIDICPIALSIGPLEIRWYGIMIVLAVVAIIAISLLEARRMGVSEDHVYNLAVWAVISGVVFSRVVHVIDKWEYYLANPGQILTFEGLGVYGAVIGVIVAIFIYCLVKKLSIWLIADLVAPGALVGMAIGRIGCVFNGCCYGLTTSLPWAVEYSCPTSYAQLGVPLYPTQEFHIIWNLAAFGILWALRRRLKPQGSVFLVYLAFYAAGDLLIRMVREGDPFLFGLQQAQVIGIAVLVIVLPWLFIRMWLYRKKRSDS